jgi:hypothetical protein
MQPNTGIDSASGIEPAPESGPEPEFDPESDIVSITRIDPLPAFPPGSFDDSPAARYSKKRANILFILLILVFFGIEDEGENCGNCGQVAFLDALVLIILWVTAAANPKVF